MIFKQLVLFCVLIPPPVFTGNVQVCWPDMAEELKYSKVIKAEYLIRYLPSLHAGVLVTLANPVAGRTRWLIHKLDIKNYSRPDTIVNDISCLTDRYRVTDYYYIYSCNKNVNDFLIAGYRSYRYNLFTANCLTAADNMWKMVKTCGASSVTKPLNYFLWCLIFFSLIQ